MLGLLRAWSYQTKLPQEAPRRSNVSSTRTVEASPDVKADDLTEEQLEQMLANCRLCREQPLLSGSVTNTVCAEDNSVPAVGPTLLFDVSIEGLPVKATIDTGAQSTPFYPSCHWTSREPEWTPTPYT